MGVDSQASTLASSRNHNPVSQMQMSIEPRKYDERVKQVEALGSSEDCGKLEHRCSMEREGCYLAPTDSLPHGELAWCDLIFRGIS